MRKKIFLVAFLVLACSLFLLTSKGSVASAMESGVYEGSTYSIKNQEGNNINSISLNKNLFTLEAEYYTATLTGGDYSTLRASSTNTSSHILVNNQDNIISQDSPTYIDLSGLNTITIQVPKSDFEDLDLYVSFVDSQETALASYPSNVSYDLTYAEDEELGTVYYLYLSSTDGSSVKIPYNSNMISLNEAYSENVSTVNNQYVLFSNLTEELMPQISFTLNNNFELPYKFIYETIDSNLNVQNYELRSTSLRCHHDSGHHDHDNDHYCDDDDHHGDHHGDHDCDHDKPDPDPDPDPSNVEATKSYSDEDSDNTIEVDEDETYTITVTNSSSRCHNGGDGGSSDIDITVTDDLFNQEQKWSAVYDLSNPSSISLDVTGVQTTPSNPTLDDLMGDGVSFTLSENETATISFTLHTQYEIPGDLNNDDGGIDEDLTNIATVEVGSDIVLNPSVTVPIER